MADGNGVMQDLSIETFRDRFLALQPLILSEWPTLDRDSLAATDGDLDRVVTLVADKTEHTRALVRRQLTELHQVSLREKPSNNGGGRERQFIQVLERFEKRASELAKELRTQTLVNAKEKVKENLLVSLLAAVGLGVVFGFLLGLLGGRGSKD